MAPLRGVCRPVALLAACLVAGGCTSLGERIDENHVSLPQRIDWLARPLDAWLQAAAPAPSSSTDMPHEHAIPR